MRGRKREVREKEGFALTFARCGVKEGKNMWVFTARDIGIKGEKR